jgi:polyketide synthase 12/candicidin polyketide synthase FscB
VPFYSTVTGGVVDGSELDAAYWFENLRRRVLFQDTVEVLARDGFRSFVESSAHPVLTVGIEETLTGPVGLEAQDVLVTGSLRRDDDVAAFTRSLATAHVHGHPIAWGGPVPGEPPAGLPGYAFDHQRYWLDPAPDVSDPGQLGLHAAGHPLLGATTGLPDGGTLYTGRISAAAHPWLLDHAVTGTPLLPATALVDLALHAGHRAGTPELAELTLEAPLVLGDQPVHLHTTVHPAGEDGGRILTVHSRAAGAEDDEPWTRHASALLTPAATASPDPDPGPDSRAAWPPPGAEPVDVDALYASLAARGYDYGPAFQGVRAAWRTPDGAVHAEIALPEEHAAQAQRHGIHPALLDAALHPLAAAGPDGGPAGDPGTPALPFAWTGVTLHATAATALRVRVEASGADGLTLTATDPAGGPVVHVERIVLRPLTPGAPARTRNDDDLLRLAWAPVPGAAPNGTADWAWLPERTGTLGDLAAALPAGADGALPGYAVLRHAPGPGADVGETTADVLGLLQRWLADARLEGTALVLLTTGGVSTGPGDRPADPATAAVWGLVRSAQTENPGRFRLIDTDGAAASRDALATALAAPGEPQLALRDGAVLRPRLVPLDRSGELALPEGDGPWRLEPGGDTFDDLALVPAPDAAAPLEPGQVRIAVRAAGLNFRDTLITLGVYPGAARLGTEAAGVVTETGPGVTGLAVGDRVTGLVSGGIADRAVTDQRLLARIPGGWSFAEAAAVPAAYLTAYYALVDLAGLRPGERLLVHAAAGGVGTAATQLARHLGAEVFGTASAAKRAGLEAAGFDAAHLADSRSPGFEADVRAATGGDGVDVVLNSLTGDFIDASLRLLPRGGRFVEMGKADLRDPAAIAAAHPGVHYRAFDLLEAGNDRIGEILAALLDLFARGELTLPPVTTWPVSRAPEALRHLAQARHTGKVVLTVPTPLDPDGTVLITGGTGTLGALTARHLVTGHGARHLLLAARRGPDTPGAAELGAELRALGAEVTVAACDAADRDALAALLAGVPAEHPLTLVVHAAGVLDDGVLSSLDAARLETVLAPKARAAAHLDELTRDADLAGLVLFSSVAGLLGGGGQASYAAANAHLDALAARRAARGLPATSVAWGLWEQASGLTAHLDGTDRARLARGGLRPLPSADALALLDAAWRTGLPALAAARFGTRAPAGGADTVPPLLRDLVRAPAARRTAATAPAPAAGNGLRDRLAGLAPADRRRELLALVRAQAAAVLGHSAADTVAGDQAFKEIGFDSLTAVELRNRLTTATGVRLTATTVFDHPTPRALAEHLDASLAPAAPRVTGTPGAPDPAGTPADGDGAPVTPEQLLRELDRLETLLPALAGPGATRSAVGRRLRELLWRFDDPAGEGDGDPSGALGTDLDTATDDELFAALDDELDQPGSGA